MEHFKSPYGPGDLATSRILENQRFFEDMLERSKMHRYYSHRFLSAAGDLTPPGEAVSFVLTSIYKLVVPFTGLLCSLGGRAPDLRSRFALMDNIYEEMGRGDLSSAHPNLYLKMLSSIGVDDADHQRTMPIIRRMNEHLRDIVDRRSFAVGCAVLASAEAVIPPLFPVLTRMALSAFPGIDRSFFDRHGPRDQGHSDDAAMLFAVTAEVSDFAAVDAAVELDLDYRAELLDEWMATLERGHYVWSALSVPPQRASDHPPARRGSVRPRPPSMRPTHRPSVPPPA